MLSAEPVCSCALSLNAHCTRDRGCSAHPVFPAPLSFLGEYFAQLGRIEPRDCGVVSRARIPVAHPSDAGKAVSNHASPRIVNPRLIRASYDGDPTPLPSRMANPMKIGTLLTAAIVSLSVVGG